MNTLLITNSIEKSKKYICQQLQTAWDIEIIKDKRKKTKEFLKESIYFKIIDNKEKYKALDINFIPGLILIVPELMWTNDDVNEGYDIARDLITKIYKSEFIQIAFLSVIEKTKLTDLVDVRNKSFVEAFPHECLLDNELNLQFEYYSEIHYKLIKHLAISDQGRLQKISHEMVSLKANIQDKSENFEINKKDLLEKLEELSLFQAWSEKNIAGITQTVRNCMDNSKLDDLSRAVDEMIDYVRIKLPKEGINSPSSKSNYKVLIIEDVKYFRELFFNTFSLFYHHVYPNSADLYSVNGDKEDLKFFSIAKAKEIIKTNAKHYQIILLDLLYKDSNKYWLNFNGLDLYKIIVEENPHAVVRIITSLPRGIVAKAVEVIITTSEKPNTDQVFTKKYGETALKDSIIESIEKINSECDEKEKIKNQLFLIPRAGIFDKPGMRDLMVSLLTNRLSEFEGRQKIANDLFNLYLKSQLTKSTEKWNKGILGKGTSFSRPTEKFFLEKLVNIMVYRLITIDTAVENDYLRIYFDEFRDKISNFSGVTGINNEFFYSIGFRLGNEQKNDEYFSVKFANLLPHESLMISQKKLGKYKILKLSSYPKLNIWIQNTILNFEYLGVIWKELEIKEFDWYKGNFNRDSITVSQLQMFFAHLYANSMKPLLLKVIKHIGDNESLITSDVDNELSKLPDLKLQIDLILNIEK